MIAQNPKIRHARLLTAFTLASAEASVLIACGGGETTNGSPASSATGQPEASSRFPGGATTNQLLLGPNAFKARAANITDDHDAQFFSGNSFFNSAWVEAPASTQARDGLGPLFNARSCSSCHLFDGRGSPPLDPDAPFGGLLLRIGTGALGAHGSPEGDPRYGGQFQPFSNQMVPPEAVATVTYDRAAGEYADGESYELLTPTYALATPAYGPFTDDLRISPRVAPVMIGLGLLEAISAEDLLALADPKDEDGDGISGRVNVVWNGTLQSEAIGRFGWKAEQPTVRQQVAGAFLGDMGLTSSIFPDPECSPVQEECQSQPSGGSPEVDEKTLDRVALYSSLLAPPIREVWDTKELLQGETLFFDLGCATCHVAKHVTGSSEFSELTGQTIWPYTDLLLHDMGDELGDDRPSFAASGNEWRTPPLWGLGRIEEINGHNRLLHDGRARGVAEAILWHGGEAAGSQEQFVQLEEPERNLLITFVESL